MLKTRAMPATNILTSAKISHVGLSLFFKQLDFSCLGIGRVEGNLEFHPYGV